MTYTVVSEKLKGHQVTINDPKRAFKAAYFDFDYFDENGQLFRARAKLENAEKKQLTVLATRRFVQRELEFDKANNKGLKKEIELLQIMKQEVDKELNFQDEARRRFAKLTADMNRMSAQLEKIFHLNKQLS